jgi:hypothetical protein
MTAFAPLRHRYGIAALGAARGASVAGWGSFFSTLDGFANHDGDWGGYWGKQGPEFLAHRATAYRDPLRMVLGATTYTSNAPFLSEAFDRTLLNAGLIDTIEVTIFP